MMFSHPGQKKGTKREVKRHKFSINRTADFKSDINIERREITIQLKFIDSTNKTKRSNQI